MFGRVLARMYLDLALLVVLGEWAVYVGSTGSCVHCTGFGVDSVPVVGNRALKRVDLLCVGAVAAFL